MIKEKEHWCCDCYHYRGDTSIGEICDLTGESTFDSRPRNSHSCDKWEECICGPLNWEDIALIDNILSAVPSMSKEEYYTEVLKQFKEMKQ